MKHFEETKKCESQNLTYFFLFVRDWDDLDYTICENSFS